MLTEPIANAIGRFGGSVETNCKVIALLTNRNRIIGVQTEQEIIATENVVLATSLEPAQHLLFNAFGQVNWTKNLLSLNPMPASTMQLELTSPVWPVDRVVFAPGTCMASFSEQSRTTFSNTSGRLSIILSEPEKRLAQSPEKILADIIADARRIGMDLKGKIKNYRAVNWPSEFYYLTPGNADLRPSQATPVKGLALAGDYTRQHFLTTMEGAVISGKKAASLLLGK